MYSSTDPLRFSWPYVYGNGNPLLWIDPLGLVVCRGIWFPLGAGRLGDPVSDPGAGGGAPAIAKPQTARNLIPGGRIAPAAPRPPGGRVPRSVIPPGGCRCGWLCQPCDEGAAPGAPLWNWGLSVHDGRDITTGDGCWCRSPGPQTGCRLPICEDDPPGVRMDRWWEPQLLSPWDPPPTDPDWLVAWD